MQYINVVDSHTPIETKTTRLSESPLLTPELRRAIKKGNFVV